MTLINKQIIKSKIKFDEYSKNRRHLLKMNKLHIQGIATDNWVGAVQWTHLDHKQLSERRTNSLQAVRSFLVAWLIGVHDCSPDILSHIHNFALGFTSRKPSVSLIMLDALNLSIYDVTHTKIVN